MSLRGALLRRPRNDTPVPYTGRTPLTSPYGLSATGDMTAEMGAYGSVGTLFAIVNSLAVDVSAVDWQLWRKAASGKEEDRVEVTRHAALMVLDKPNQFMTRQEFFESFQQHLDLTGETWWVYAYTSGLSSPTEIWPVRPDRMTPVPDRETFLKGYVYRGPEGEKIPLSLDEVTQIRMPSPLDPYRGMGPVQTVLADLDSSRYSAEWNRRFFLNDATPGGIIEVPNSLQDDELDELVEHWDRQHKGIGNAHRVAFVEQGKWVDRKYSQQDMQFTELRDLSRDVIREAFRFPKAMLGLVDDVNRATAEAQDYMYGSRLIKPRLDRIKGALNSDFLPLFDEAGVLEFDYCNPVPADVETDMKALESKVKATTMLVRGGFDAAQACAVTGLPLMTWRAEQMTATGASQAEKVAP